MDRDTARSVRRRRTFETCGSVAAALACLFMVLALPDPGGARAAPSAAETLSAPALRAGHRAQLGAYHNPDNAQTDWSRIDGRYGDLLAEFDACVQRADLGPVQGVFHRLQVGPLESSDAARRLCKAFKAGGQDCFAVSAVTGANCFRLDRYAAGVTQIARAVPLKPPAVLPVPPTPPLLPEPLLLVTPPPAAEPTQTPEAPPAVVAVLSNPVGTPTKPAAEREAEIEFDFDSPPDTRYRLTPTLSYGAEVEVSVKIENNYDLDDGSDDDLTTAAPEASLAFALDPGPLMQAFLQIDIERKFVVDGPDRKKSDDLGLKVTLAYLTFPEIAEGLAFQLGRQRFKDEREWIYDQKLDAARLFYRAGPFGLEASVSREELVDRDLLNKDSTRDIDNFFLIGRYAISRDAELNAYALYRDDRSVRNRDLAHFGLRAIGEITDSLEFWADAAHVTGENGSEDLSGFGVDVGATYVFDTAFEPSLTLGIAFGTGDEDPNDGEDDDFRQTGLEDNSGKFNGVTQFKYYGEVLDPELRNMAIVTAGIGVRPTKRSSVDLVYHYYQQHHASTTLSGVDIDLDPEGREPELGHGVDLVVGYREIENVDIEFVLGAFVPGDAFSAAADTAWFGGLEIGYDF